MCYDTRATTMTTIRDIIREEVQKAINDRGDRAWMGSVSTGAVIVPNNPAKVYVTDLNGNVIEAWNSNVPTVPALPIFVKMINGRLQVTEQLHAFQDYQYPNVGPHHQLHEWNGAGSDIVRVWGDALMMWDAIPIPNTLTFSLYRQIFNGTTWVDASTETVDLTSHVPGSNTRYVLISINASGTTVITDGSAVASPVITDIPAVPTGNKALWAIKLAHGQTTLTYNPAQSDFKDLRWSGAEGGGGGGSGNATELQGTDIDAGLSPSNGDVLTWNAYDGQWEAVYPSSGGNVSDTGSTTANHLAVWNGTNDHTIKDGGAIPTPGVTRSGSTTEAHLVVWNGSSADSIRDGGSVPSLGGGDVFGNASVIDGHLAVFDVDGYHIKDGGAVPASGGSPAINVYLANNFI